MGFGAASFGVQFDDQLNLVADKSTQQPFHAGDNRADVDNCAALKPSPAKCKHLTREQRGFFAGFHNSFKSMFDRVVRVDFIEKDLTVAADQGEHVINVVSRASSKESKHFHLLRPVQSSFEVFSLADIARDSFDGDNVGQMRKR